MDTQLQFSFDLTRATAYMQVMFHLEGQRDELNDAITGARTEARDAGVPTKAVEAAIKAAKGRRKAALTPAEFGALMDAAEAMMPRDEPDGEARNRDVWKAAQGLTPARLGPGVESVTLSTRDQSVTIGRSDV
jgi:hypothetical protein